MKVAPAPGEPLRLALVASNDAGLAAFVNETLTPLIASDKGCRVEAVILDPRNALMHVTATGLPRGGSFTLASDSGGNATVMNLTADKTGHYSAGLMPASPSKKTGTIRLRLLASTCRVTLGVPYVLTQ
jgi:hypothetical protein